MSHHTASGEPGKVLILGANGRLGAAAVHAFANAGWQVVAQTRRPPSTPWPAPVQALVGPLNPIETMVNAARGATHVVHALNPSYTEWSTQLLPMASQGMDIAQALGATFMLPGNVYNFGASMPPVLTTTTPERPSTRKGELRCQLEAAIAAQGAQGLRSVVIRAGDFYGAGSGSWMDLVILKSLPKGKLVYPGPWATPHAWAYLPDLARTLVLVAEKHNTLPVTTRLHFQGHTLTGEQLLDALEQAAQKPSQTMPTGRLKRSRMPWWPLRLASPFAPMLREVADMAYLWDMPHTLNDEALQNVIGPVPCTPLHQAMAATINHQQSLNT
jgi:nucleoside-diphosphate-sugar epimerase